MPDDPELMEMLRGQFTSEYPNIEVIIGQVIHDQSTVVGKGCDDHWKFAFGLDLILDGLERVRERGDAPRSVATQDA